MFGVFAHGFASVIFCRGVAFLFFSAFAARQCGLQSFCTLCPTPQKHQICFEPKKEEGTRALQALQLTSENSKLSSKLAETNKTTSKVRAPLLRTGLNDWPFRATENLEFSAHPAEDLFINGVDSLIFSLCPLSSQ